MKVQELEKFVLKAQRNLRQAEVAAAGFEKTFRTAKTKNRQAKRAYKAARRRARKARKLACNAAERLAQRQQAFDKARKRLAKAWKKIGLLEAVPKTLPAPKASRVSGGKLSPAVVPAVASVPLPPRQSEGACSL